VSAVPHLGFIVAAYALTALVVGGLLAAALLDRRALRRALAALEARTGRTEPRG
jgi:heme exporter protein D